MAPTTSDVTYRSRFTTSIILLTSVKGLILPAASCLYTCIIILANDSSLQKQFNLTLLVDTPGLHLLLPGVPDLQ